MTGYYIQSGCTNAEEEWEMDGDAQFEEGRIILTPKASTWGALNNPTKLNTDRWTVEAVFRSVGSRGKNGGAIALQYSTGGIRDTVWNEFDGLKVVVDSNSELGSSVHGFLDTRTKDLAKIEDADRYKESFGSCLLPYQDSQVPTTLRIAYYDGFLVVQVNNRICLKTKRVKLPKGRFVGVMAQSSGVHEQFELLRLKTYDGVISEVLENDGFSAFQPKVVQKIVQVDEKGQPEKQSKQQPKQTKQQAKQEAKQHKQQTEPNNGGNSNAEILEQLASLKSQIRALAEGASPNELSSLDAQEKKFKQLSVDFESLSTNVRGLRTTLTQLTAIIEKLNNDNVDQLRENEQTIKELSNKVEYLVLAEKQRHHDTPISDLIAGLKYLILPLIFISLGLCFMAYRLRHDIKTKLL